MQLPPHFHHNHCCAASSKKADQSVSVKSLQEGFGLWDSAVDWFQLHLSAETPCLRALSTHLQWKHVAPLKVLFYRSSETAECDIYKVVLIRIYFYKDTTVFLIFILQELIRCIDQMLVFWRWNTAGLTFLKTTTFYRNTSIISGA